MYKEGDGQTFTLSSHMTMNYKPRVVQLYDYRWPYFCQERSQLQLPDLASRLGPPLDCSSLLVNSCGLSVNG